MSEHGDDLSEPSEVGESQQNDFATPSEPTTKVPALKRKGLMKRDAEHARSRTAEEEE